MPNSERGYSEWTRDGGWSNGEDDEPKRKPVNKDDLDVVVPTEEIGDENTDVPDKDIDQDDLPDLDIVPVTPDTGKNIDEDEEAVIRGSIIREGILDDMDNPSDKDKEAKN